MFADAFFSIGWLWTDVSSLNLSLLPHYWVNIEHGSADEHPGPVILDFTAITTGIGLDSTLHLEKVDLGAYVQAGLFVSYDENPTTSGSYLSGLTGTLGIYSRYWFTEYVAIQLGFRRKIKCFVLFGCSYSTATPIRI